MQLSTEIVLYDHTDRIDVINTLDKPPTSRAEVLYHAFPPATRHGHPWQ